MSNPLIIIVGQGIAGTCLSWYLHRAGINFLVIDDDGNSASKAAAGIINPVTGRRVVKVWMDDILLPFAENFYQQIGKFLNIDAITKTELIDFFPNPFMRENYLKKINQQTPYIQIVKDENQFTPYFNYEFGCGAINPAYIIHLQKILPAWRSFLKQQNKLIEAPFNHTALHVTNQNVCYQNITATKIIFCDGSRGSNNPYFSSLPFALNKGESIIINAPSLPAHHIYKKSMLLVPLGNHKFWTGTNYIWDYADDQPTESFKNNTQLQLQQWLKTPFHIVQHFSAIRPATVERRPFAGFHPVYKNVGILNGMGTKGCSLAPYFAHQLCQNLFHNTPLQPEVDINRFQKILSR